MNNILDDLYTLCEMTKRNLKIFLKDKVTVFFSLLAPLIVLLLYILFLGDIQFDALSSNLPKGVIPEKDIKAFLDSWMIAGVVSVACITVALGANSVMVQDKEKGVMNDCLSSPVKRSLITASYFLYNFVVTMIICSIVLIICLIYLGIRGYFYMTFSDVAMSFLALILSSLSATTLMVFLTSFLKNVASLSAISGIMSAVVGFVIGAYMPISVFPKGVQYLTNFIPGTYSACIFRNIFMRGSMKNLIKNVPSSEISSMLKETYSLNLNFFGNAINLPMCYIILGVSIVIFLVLNLVFMNRKIK